MATYDLAISDTRFVFNKDYDTISFYSISQGKITIGERLYLNQTPKYVKLKLTGSTLTVTTGLGKPADGTFSEQATYGPDQALSDAWNSPSEIIVGTGDLRPAPGTMITPKKYPMTNKGIVITSPGDDIISIYQLQ